MNKFCVLTHQRSGSTYCLDVLAKHINNTYGHCYNLGEIFEPTNQRSILIKNVLDGSHITGLLQQELPTDVLLEHNIRYVQNLENYTAFVVKLFHHPIETKERIISLLRSMNTEFIWLRRKNMEQVYMSYLLSSTQRLWANAEYSKVNIPKDVALEAFADCRNMHLSFDAFMNRVYPLVSKKVHVVHYETLGKDLSRILGHPIEVNSDSKQAKRDHYEYIENGPEIREALLSFLDHTGGQGITHE